MVWSHPLDDRRDILLEVLDNLDGSGEYTSPWIETSGVNTARVAVRFNGGTPTTRLEEGIYSSGANDPSGALLLNHVVTSANNPAYGEVPISGRYFRLLIEGGTASGTFRASIRMVD